MDEEEELENTLIGQEEEAPAMNTADIIMGAGIPASAFGQAPAVNPFSMEAARQVNPMMQQQSLEAPDQPQVTFQDYDVPEPPRASALSVFTPSGDLKPGIDVNAITPAPTTSTPPVAPKNALLEMLERADERERMGLPRQNAPGIIDAPPPVVDPFTGQTIENPTPFNANNSLPAGMTMSQAAIMNALSDQNQGMDMNQQAISNAQIQGVTQGQETTQGQKATAPSLDQTLSQFMRNEDAPEQRTEQFVDPQGRLRRRLTPEASALQGFAPGVQPLAPEYTDFERESLARQIRSGGTGSFAGDSAALQARIAERDRLPGETQTERDTRIARSRTTGGQTEGISMADRTAMAKANARGATPREVAYGNQVAAELGVDLRTGQPLQTTGGLTFDQQLALRKQKFAEDKFDYELTKDLKADFDAGIKASKEATVDEAKAETSGKTMVSAINNMNDAMTRMGSRSNEFFGSGFFGRASSFIPGTSAYDQVADAEFLQSNVALGAMAELKRLSSTGATGFGSLSERELNVLTAKFANLNPFVSPELFQSNLRQLQGEFNNMLDNAWNTHSAEYGEEAANKIYGYRGGGASRTTGGTGGTTSGAIPGDRNVASAADALLSDPKYN